MKQKTFLVASILFGLLFVLMGFNKFFNFIPMPADMPEASKKAMEAFMSISWLMPLVGAAEVLGGLLIMIPKTRIIGALVMVPLMVGIVLHNIIVDRSGLPMTLVLTAILIWILVENKEKLLALNSK
jgi:uncharacterized membrane protein YphA (DoxX/SURF4 family)